MQPAAKRVLVICVLVAGCTRFGFKAPAIGVGDTNVDHAEPGDGPADASTMDGGPQPHDVAVVDHLLLEQSTMAPDSMPKDLAPESALPPPDSAPPPPPDSAPPPPPDSAPPPPPDLTIPPDLVPLQPDLVPPMVVPSFSPPQKVPNVNSSSTDDGPHLSADSLRLYFSSSRSSGLGNSDIWTASRSSTSSGFNAPVLVSGVNTSGNEADPTLTDSELVIVFERAVTGKGLELFQAARTSKSGSFGTPTQLASLGTDQDDEDPGLSPDGLTIVFSSNRPGGKGSSDLYVATRTSIAAAFGGVTLLSTLNSSGKEADPALHAPYYLTFESNRAGGLGGTDLYISMRPGTGYPWGAPVQLTGLCSPQEDEDPFLHVGLKTIIFESNRGGNSDLYYSTY